MDTLNRWFERSQSKADFRVIYITEAHPTDGRQTAANERDGILIAQPKTIEERKKAAAQLRNDLKLKLPIFVDRMDDAAGKAYAAWPDRLFVIDRDGKVAYAGGQGPAGFRPAEAIAALDRMP